MRKRITAVLLVLVAAVAVVALPAGAALPKLVGTVGPGFTITMKKPTKAGRYTLVVSDRSASHNFHLRRTGGGVNVKTGVATSGKRTFTVKLTKGQYTFVCDPHASSMRGSFRIR
jgi:plastocyanin